MSKYWGTMCEILERQFPKHGCKERGRALVLLAYIEMMLNGTEFFDGEPLPQGSRPSVTVSMTPSTREK